MQIDKRNRTDLKRYFVKNAIPTESQFAELIEGMLNQRDDGIAKLPNDPLSLEAAGDPVSQKKAIHFYNSFSDPDPTWVISLNPRQNPANAATARAGFSISDGAGASRLFIDRASGRIGIGTLDPKKTLHVQGATSGPFINDANDRPAVVVTGNYPEIALFSNVNNTNHGPTIRLGSYTDGTATPFKQWVIGTSGRNSSFLDFGFSDKNDPNPHAGIRNYNGKTILTLNENGNVEVTGTALLGSVEVTGGALLGYESSISNFNVPLRSGFYQNGGVAATGDIPDRTHSWTHLFVQRHSNTGNNHQLQIASGYNMNDRLFFRKVARVLTDGAGADWHELATRETNTFSGLQDMTVGATLRAIGIGAQPYGTVSYPYETIQMNPGHNLRIWFGTTERFVLQNNGLLTAATVNLNDSDIYFVDTEHVHSGYGNTAGFAAIENAKDYDALMILGRAGTPQGRKIRMWDWVKVEGTLANLSDATSKKDIASLDYGLAEIKKLRPVEFNWIDRPNPHKSLGLIGQEVREILREVVYDEDGEVSISYLGLIPVLINAIKDLDAKIEALFAAPRGP